MMCLLLFEGGELPHNALHFYFFSLISFGSWVGFLAAAVRDRCPPSGAA